MCKELSIFQRYEQRKQIFFERTKKVGTLLATPFIEGGNHRVGSGCV